MSDRLVTPHFKHSELACPCCGKMNMPQHMLDFIERVRTSLNMKMKITSAVRCGMYNAKLGSKITSAHLQGLAIDVFCPSESYRFKLLAAAFSMGVLGVGIYDNPKDLSKKFVHLDLLNRVAGPQTWVEVSA